MNLHLKNKTIFITGSTKGIGKAIAENFLAEEAYVIINGRDSSSLSSTKASLKKKYPHYVEAYHGDMTKQEDIITAKKHIVALREKIDILVLNVGSGKSSIGVHTPIEEFQRMMTINLVGAVTMVNLFLPTIKKNGSIIFISSVAGLEHIGAPIGYAIAKAGLIVLTKQLAFELSPKKIRVNAIAPGNIYFKGGRWEEIVAKHPEIITNYIKEDVALKRFGKPQEVADVVVFLASQNASFITGATIVVDGGQLKQYF